MTRVHPLLVLLLPAMLACSVTSSPKRPSYEEERTRYDAPDLADEYARLKRLGERTDLNPPQLYARAQDALQSMRAWSVTLDRERPSLAERAFAREAAFGREAAADRALARWSWLGPGNIGGRTRTLVIDPQQTATMYTGGVSGGVWKTTDGGAAWRPTGDTLANIAINSLVMDPRDHNRLYAGTGEGYFRETVRGTALPLRGGGIFVSTNAGESWSILESTRTSDFHFVNDLFVSSVANRIYAATRTGVFRSSDGGQSWTRVLSVTTAGGCLDLVARPGAASDYLYVSCGTLDQATVYRNVDAAADGAWSAVLSEANMGRTSIAVAPSNPDIVYALSASNVSAPGGFN
jgi:hypothetical protein